MLVNEREWPEIKSECCEQVETVMSSYERWNGCKNVCLSNHDCQGDKMKLQNRFVLLLCMIVVHSETHTWAVLKLIDGTWFRFSLDVGLLFVWFSIFPVLFAVVRFSSFGIAKRLARRTPPKWPILCQEGLKTSVFSILSTQWELNLRRLKHTYIIIL